MKLEEYASHDGLGLAALVRRREVKPSELVECAIQAIEALWKARVDPRSRAGAIGRADVVRIGRAVHWTIERTRADLAKGGTESPFRVYGRSGQPCPRCKTPLERIELGGRTTRFCPGCQRRLR